MKGQKAYQNDMATQATREQDRRDKVDAQLEKDQAERKAMIAGRRTAINKKQYASGNVPGLVFSMGDPAKRHAMREATMGLPPAGAAAMGYDRADPTALAMQKQYLNDSLDRDNAAAFEGDVKNYIADTDAMEAGYYNGTNATNVARENTASSNALGYQNQRGNSIAQSAQWLPSVVGGVAGMAGSMFSGGLTSLMPKRA